jgi:uncharacterized protein with von Willebrand factor type A (vWA) domain
MSAAAAAGPVARLRGFVAHLRLNGFALGPRESEAALAFLAAAGPLEAATARLGLKTMLSGDRGQWERFDALFDAYWLGRGVSTRAAPPPRGEGGRPAIWSNRLPPETESAFPQAADAGAGEGEPSEAQGRLVASRRESLSRSDLRRLTDPADIDAAERLAERLARVMRYRLSRRRIPAPSGDALDLRRTIRRNLGKGGEPIDLLKKRRPDRPVNLVLLLDVSGSMRVYSRYLLAFARGLIGGWLKADAFCFHTRLIHISDALRERDRLRAMDRLALMVEGFGGGTRIAGAVQAFNDRYARECLDSRSVVIMMSDGYDTDPPEDLARELERLKHRARRLVWLNPLLGWRDYTPVARAMAAAMPYIDCFAAANTLESLGALEGELAKL